MPVDAMHSMTEETTRSLEDGLAEEEGLLVAGIAFMCSLHVFVHLSYTFSSIRSSISMSTNLRYRQVEVQTKAKDCSTEQHDEKREGGILKVCELDFHATELDTPSDWTTRWRWLESHCLPVGRLNVLGAPSDWLQLRVDERTSK